MPDSQLSVGLNEREHYIRFFLQIKRFLILMSMEEMVYIIFETEA